MSQENKLERLESKWMDAKPEERSRYIFQNYNKKDCQLQLKENRIPNPQKILSSYKWILTDSSPYFKKTFESNPNCKEVDLYDLGFEDILCYVHTRFLPDQPFEKLLDLYKRAKPFEIDGLGKVIMDKLNFMIANDGNTWIDLFKKIYMENLLYGFESELKSVLWTREKTELNKIIEMSIAKIITFDLDLLITFIYNVSPYIERPFLLQILETYMENQNFFPILTQANDIKKICLKLLCLCMNYKPDLQEFQSYPKLLELLK